MALTIKHRLQLGIETTRGTPASALLVEWPIIGDGVRHSLRNHQGEILASSTFPYKTDSVPLGVTHSVSARVEVNRDNIRDIITLATQRTAGVLPAATIVHDQSGVGVARLLGCVVRSLNLELSRSGDPDVSNLLTATLEWECMSGSNGEGAINTGLTPANAPRFQIRHGTYTINSVAALVLLSLRIGISNDLSLGPPNSSNVRSYLEEGFESQEVRTVQRFASTAWRALLEGSTQAAASFVLATGVANETVTATLAKNQFDAREIGAQDGVVTEEMSLMPFGSPAIAWSFGIEIGASTLFAS